mgnify:CR=1 FL=1
MGIRCSKNQGTSDGIVKICPRSFEGVILKNAFDVLVCFRSVWTPLEIKDGAKLPVKFHSMPPDEQEKYLYSQLTEGEKKFCDDCKVKNSPFEIVWDIQSALRAIGATKPKFQ